MEPAFIFGWFIVVFILVITAVGASSKRVMGDKKIRNLQAKAAMQVFGLLGVLVLVLESCFTVATSPTRRMWWAYLP